MYKENDMSDNKELDIYDDMEESGYDKMGGDKFTIPLLLIAGPTSGVIAQGNDTGIKMGDWYNSITKESYGPEIEVVPCYFDEAWYEWKPNLGGLVGVHAPNSIKVKGDVYTGMTNADGNDIIDTWIYYVLIKGREDEGMLKLAVTSTGIKYAKIWNGLAHDYRLASGKRAPLFSQYWKLTLEKNTEGKNTWFIFGKGSSANIKHAGQVPPQVYLDYIKPVREIAPQLTLKIDQQENNQLAIEDNTDKY